MWKTFRLPLVIIFIGCALLAVLVVAKPKPTPKLNNEPPALIQVAVLSAKPQTLSLAVDAQGTVEPKRQITLIAEVSGLIVNVDTQFSGGGFFSKNQTLLKIDPRDYLTAELSAKARLAEAERRLAEEQGLARQAQREWRDLGNQNANDLFIRKPQLTAAKANLAFAQADLNRAQLDLARTSIKAPFDGRIRETTVDVGQFVNKGNALATLYDTAVAQIRLPLTEAQAALIDLPLNLQAKNTLKPEVLIKGVVAGTPYTWQGVLARTDAFIDTRTRMYYAIVEVANPFMGEVPLLPGLFVDAQIEGKKLNNVLKLPRTALFKRNKIFIIDNENKTKELTVRVLRKTADTVWLQGENIRAGSKIVTEKHMLIPEGTPVDPILKDALSSQAKTAKTINTQTPALSG